MNNSYDTSFDKLSLTNEEQELLKTQQKNYFYLLIGFLVLTCAFSFPFYSNYTQQEKIEMKLTLLFCGVMWMGVMIFIGKIYLSFTQDLTQNKKISITGIIEKISTSIGENGGNTSIFMAGKKYQVIKEGTIAFSNLFDFIQEGDKATLYLAPQSKFLLGIKRIHENYTNEEFTQDDE